MRMPGFPTLALTAFLAAGLCVGAESLKPADVQVFGALDYGESSPSVEHTGTPKFGAFLFNGTSKDRIEVTVKSDGGQALVGIADGSLTELVSGTTKLTFVLPDHGSDPEAYYIIFREVAGKRAQFIVSLKKVPASSPAARLTFLPWN